MTTITNSTPSTFDSLGLGVNSAQANTSVQGNTGATSSTSGDLGQKDFLELMVAQLKNQDPFKPMESGEFLSQLAQFGTVNGIQGLQSSFGQLVGSLQSVQALQASSLVGRSVLVKGDTGVLTAGGSLGGVIDLQSSAGDVSVKIFDASGQMIKELKLGAKDAGRVAFTWDGLTDGGQAAPAGQYKIKAEAVVGNQTVSVDTLLKANVESVTLGQGGKEMTLNVAGLGPMALSTVNEIF